MFDRVLIPLDGSAAAENAIPQVAALLKTRAVEIVLYRAVDVPMMMDIAEADYLGTMHDQAQRYLASQAERVAKLGPSARGVAKYEAAADGIVGAAQREGAELIAMTTHGRTGISRWVFGSVTEKVLRSGTEVPVLVLHTFQPVRPVKRILVPLDGSARSQAVLPYAAEIADRCDAEIVLLNVREEHLPFPLGGDPQERLREAAEPLAARRLRVSTVVREGDPALRIVEMAETDGTGLIAMTTHGRSGVSRWILGSVTEKVLRGTGVPILVVRG